MRLYENRTLNWSFLDPEILRFVPFRLREKKFRYSDLTDEEKDTLYQNFYDSYTKSVGSAWDKEDFEWRANGWVFYGDVTGGIALRSQRSGMYKLNAVYGGKVIVKAYREMMDDIGDQPIWGLVTKSRHTT